MSIPVDIIKKIAELGNDLSDHVIEATYSLYEPLYKQMAEADAANVTMHNDLAYGEHALQTLDIYQPAQVLAGKNPILIYIHGGGFVEGDKANHANLGNYFAKQGCFVICANYRLAPDFLFPAGADDIALIIKWAQANAPTYNADDDNIFVMGHSAGAAHVADYAAGASGSVNPAFKGALLISGASYDLRTIRPQHEYYSEVQHDPARYGIIDNIAKLACPLFVAFAEYEPERIAKQNKDFIKALLMADFAPYPSFKYALCHNHVSITRSFNTGDESVGGEAMRFVRRYAQICKI